MLPLLLFLQLPPVLDLPNVSSNPHTTAADVSQGQKLYMGRCAGCHGPDGDGGKGANLAVPELPRASTDPALYRVIRYGISDTEMPQSLMAPREVWQVAAYVRSLGAVRREPVSGDAARGAQVVRGRGGCVGCHTIGLEGGRMGPALTDIGTRRSPGHLRNKILDAQSDLPDHFRMVSFATKDGKPVSGVRLNEDTYSIQLRDNAARLQSFWKRDVSNLKVEKKSPMPSYKGKLTDAEVNDAVAYLVTLRGAQ
jgi:putative heme-binding domain-containing protein